MSKVGFFISSFTVAVIMLGGAALSQSPGMVADIPFDFYVGNTLLSSGEYVVASDVARHTRVVQVKSREGQSAFANTLTQNGVDNNTKCELVFHKYGRDLYFMSEIRIPGVAIKALLKSRAEREIVTTDWEFKEIAIALRPADLDEALGH